MTLWSIGEWDYLERRVVRDPKGREWTVALMDVLGQAGDPELPSRVLEMQYQSGRYFTLIYTSRGAIQRERGFRSLEEAAAEYRSLLADLANGDLDPAQPVYRENLEE
jgi:hypothetical protein